MTEIPPAKHWGGALPMLEKVGQESLDASTPEDAMRVLALACHQTLGDRQVHFQSGTLLPNEHQFFVSGVFVVTPDNNWHMLVGSVGFPDEQQRLLIPIDGGHPGHVYATQKKLLLANTDDHAAFKQYLKTGRMGSAIFAPMIFRGHFVGQLIMAAQARYTMRESDLDIIVALSRVATGVWIAQGGPDWLRKNYPPINGFYVEQDGIVNGIQTQIRQ